MESTRAVRYIEDEDSSDRYTVEMIVRMGRSFIRSVDKGFITPQALGQQANYYISEATSRKIANKFGLEKFTRREVVNFVIRHDEEGIRNQ